MPVSIAHGRHLAVIPVVCMLLVLLGDHRGGSCPRGCGSFIVEAVGGFQRILLRELITVVVNDGGTLIQFSGGTFTGGDAFQLAREGDARGLRVPDLSRPNART